MGIRRHGIALSQSHALGQGCPHGATNVALCRNPTDPVLSQPSSSSSLRVPTSSHPGSPYSPHPSPTPRTMPPTKYFASEGSAGRQALDSQIPLSHRNQRPPHCQPRTSRQLLRHTPWCGSFHRRHSSNPLGWDCFSHSFFLRGMVCRHSQFQASERPITALPICRADAQHYHHRGWQKPHRRVQPDPYLHGSGLSILCTCEEESGSLGRGRRGRWFSGKDDAQPAPGEFSQRRLPPHQLFGNGSNVPPQPSPALPNPGPAPCPSHVHTEITGIHAGNKPKSAGANN